jgi:D-beta-D-heptose 7-phosphate kinase/D-beta-D-heptose 1-phosphate adenosyltransferase
VVKIGRVVGLPISSDQEKKEPVVFANGCFDLLHPGHISLLEYCATIGYVIVGLNSDASVSRLKGPTRPIMNQDQRKYSLESCRFVDEVHIFDEDTPLELIKKLRPDYIVKGSEFRKDEVIGAEYAEVLLFTPTHNVSTTKILNRVTREKSHAD